MTTTPTTQREADEPCKRCNGEGCLHTGIDEAPTTLCERCDGSGIEAPAATDQPSAGQVDELVAAADAVVERWHSRDWKQPHTAEFIARLAAAVGEAKRASLTPTAPADTNYETKLEQQVGALQRENDNLRTLLNTERARYFMEHGVLHDRVTGDHLWTQDQYDEQWRDMYKAGQEDAANGFNMLTGKPITPTAPQAASQQAEKAIGEVVQGGRCELIPVRLYGQRPEVGAILYAPQTATTASAAASQAAPDEVGDKA